MKTCAACGQPIYPMEATYSQVNPERSYHTACGDPFGLKAKDAEIERLRGIIRRTHSALCKGSLTPIERIYDAVQFLSNELNAT